MAESIATLTDLQRFKDEILEAVQAINTKAAERNKYYSAAEVRELLGVSAKQFQTMRDERRISFIQIGRKIYVSQKDLDNYMESHKIKAKN